MEVPSGIIQESKTTPWKKMPKPGVHSFPKTSLSKEYDKLFLPLRSAGLFPSISYYPKYYIAQMKASDEQIFLLCRDPFNRKVEKILSLNPIVMIIEVDFCREDGYPEYNLEVISTVENTYMYNGVVIPFKLTSLPCRYWGCTDEELSEIMDKALEWYHRYLESIVNRKDNTN